MSDEGPQLEALTHRLAECPPEFLLAPDPVVGGGEIDVTAIVCDHLRAIGGRMPGAAELALLGVHAAPASANRGRLIAVATWLLHDEWFLARPALAPAVWTLLSQGLDDLAAVVSAQDVVRDPDRREEFVRVCLKHLGLRPRGETVVQATDRLNTLDSAERLKVVRQTRDAEARARAIREKMAADAARAAAARYAPE